MKLFIAIAQYTLLLLSLNIMAQSPRGSANALVAAAIERSSHKVTYDGSYRAIPYPNGDVPNNIGVCTDVVIRSYRKLGIDLQQRVLLQ